jgi:hypothetical protein
MKGVIIAQQQECGKHRLKRKVSINDMKRDIAAKYRDLRIVQGKSGKQKEWLGATNHIRI